VILKEEDEAVGASVDDFIFFFAGSRFLNPIVLGSTFRRGILNIGTVDLT